MIRKPGRKAAQHTAADHRPMIPALRPPIDPMDSAIRSTRCSDPLIEPKDYLNWR